MIPATLTDIRDNGKGEIVLHKMKGLCETPPILGHRLIMTLPSGEVVKTGIVELLEWFGTTMDDCMFSTNGSAYRWKRTNGENRPNAPDAPPCPKCNYLQTWHGGWKRWYCPTCAAKIL
jgi:hypothetical protein